MGQKVHPNAFRLHTLTTWPSRWFADRKRYRQYLEEDVGIRRMITLRFRDAGVTDVIVERSANTVTVEVRAARPGVIIGRGGQSVEALKRDLRALAGGSGAAECTLNILEADRPALRAEVVLQQIIGDIEKRLPTRRVLRQALGRVERAGAQGVRIQVSGRLNGAEIARRESVMHGSVPLHTLRADISYAQGFARTMYGAIGVKVWIYRGQVFEKERERGQGRVPAPSAASPSSS